jgi:hypothetical protein
MRSAAVLCPGPSLANVRAADLIEYDALLGVNRAVERAACQWWVALDAHTFGFTRPVNRPVLVTSRGTYRSLRARTPELADWPWLDCRWVDPIGQHVVRWRKTSMTTAIVLAAELGAKRIDVYGCDWDGEADWDGRTDARYNRGEDKAGPDGRTIEGRWTMERRLFAELAEALAGRGATVKRCRVQSSEF